jgi:hypothetical protein
MSNLLAQVLDAHGSPRAGVELLLTLSGSLLEIKGYPNGLVSEADDLALLKGIANPLLPLVHISEPHPSTRAGQWSEGTSWPAARAAAPVKTPMTGAIGIRRFEAAKHPLLQMKRVFGQLKSL